LHSLFDYQLDMFEMLMMTTQYPPFPEDGDQLDKKTKAEHRAWVINTVRDDSIRATNLAYIYKALMCMNEELYQKHLNPILDRFGQDQRVGPGLKWAKAFDAYFEEFIVYAADHTLDSTCYVFGSWSLPPPRDHNHSKEDQCHIHIDNAIMGNFYMSSEQSCRICSCPFCNEDNLPLSKLWSTPYLY
jgi:hypothetical protein